MADFMSKLKTVAIKKKNRMYIDQSSDVSTVDWFVWFYYPLLIDQTERHAFESFDFYVVVKKRYVLAFKFICIPEL